MRTPLEIYREYQKLKDDWESICNCCGRCCYTRTRSHGEVIVDFSKPCEFLDTDYNLCKIYENRFSLNGYCGKVSIFTALFSRYLPKDCAYVKTFRNTNK